MTVERDALRASRANEGLAEAYPAAVTMLLPEVQCASRWLFVRKEALARILLPVGSVLADGSFEMNARCARRPMTTASFALHAVHCKGGGGVVNCLSFACHFKSCGCALHGA